MSYSKYYIYKEQISFDNGVTWMDTGQATPSGDPIGTYETLGECEGVVPPTPTNKKLVAIYSDSKTLEVECNSSGTLITGETQPFGYQASAMTSAVIGECVTAIGPWAFYLCGNLASVTIPNFVTSIGLGAFGQCSGLTSVNIPNSVISIGLDAFNLCEGLASVTIPNSVISIDDGAFRACSGLTNVIIGSGITNIGMEAFNNCFQLKSLTCLATTPPTLGVNFNVFEYTNNCPLLVPASSVSAYKNAWTHYADRIQAIP